MMMKEFVIFVMLILFTAGCENTAHNTPHTEEAADPDIVLEPDEDSVETPLIFDVKVEQNEKNVLSCRLTFKTKEKTKIVVRYFSKDHKGYEIVEENEKTDHYFFLWGMRAEKKYTIEIYDSENLNEIIGTSEYATGFLPDTVHYMFLSVNEKDKVSDGFVLFTTSATIVDKANPVALMVDTEGEVVWYFEYYMAGFNVLGDMQFIDETSTIIISLTKGPNMAEIMAEEAIEIDLEGNLLWKSPEAANIYDEPGSWNHIYEWLSDDTILMLRANLESVIQFQNVVNVDRDYNVIWTWSPFDHFETPDCDPSSWCDWTHFNSVSMFKDAGVVYLNSRNMSKYFKIDMNSGNVVWTLGKDGDFTIETENTDPWFEVAHDPEIKSFDGDTVIFYDNGSLERGFSRVIEYKLNFEDMTAEVSFVYDGTNDGRMWFTEYWGDADSLPNGNIFVTAGDYQLYSNSRLFEVTREGEVVWELFMDKQEDWIVALYNAQKFVPPLKRLD